MTYLNNITSTITGPVSQFNEVSVVQRTPTVELFSQYGTSVYRNIRTEQNGATVTGVLGQAEIELVTGTTASALGRIDSAEASRYMPGYNVEIGIGIRLDSEDIADYSAGQEVIWGTLNNTDGFLYSYSSLGLRVAEIKDGVYTYITRANFNGDKLDGTGPSGLTLDLSRGNVFNVLFSWYGYGIIQYKVIMVTATGQIPITMHTLSVPNQTSVNNPNLPIRVSAFNGVGGATASRTVYLGGRQASIVGKYDPVYRLTGDYVVGKTGITTTLIPIITYRRKSTFKGITIRIEGFDVLSTNQSLIVTLVLNGTLTGASYVSINGIADSETSVQKDVSATAITGGNIIFRALSNVGQSRSANGSTVRSLSLDIPEDQPITLAVRTTSGTNGEGNFVFTIKEEW
jgi:hypothetical protein